MEVGLVVGNGGKGVFGLGFLFPCRNLVIHTDIFVFYSLFSILNLEFQRNYFIHICSFQINHLFISAHFK